MYSHSLLNGPIMGSVSILTCNGLFFFFYVCACFFFHGFWCLHFSELERQTCRYSNYGSLAGCTHSELVMGLEMSSFLYGISLIL